MDVCESCKVFQCLFCLKFLVEIGSFVCVCILCGLSSDNPFESHRIGNLSNYFYDVENTTDLIKFINKYNNINIKHFTTKEKKLNRRKSIFSKKDIKKKYLRKLVSKSFCLEIRDNFAKLKGSKLSNVFDLNYGKIFKTSIAILVISCVLLLFYIIFMCLIHKNSYRFDNKCCGCFIALFIILLYVARFILSIILFYFMEKGDVEKYDDFLDCDNVKVKYFNRFSDINKLRKCFIAFVILNIIIQGIDQIEKCIDCAEKTNEDLKKNYNGYKRQKYFNYFYTDNFY